MQRLEPLSAITNIPTELLSELRNQPPFHAEILAVFVKRDVRPYGQGMIATNSYLIAFRDQRGGHRVIRGLNVPPKELDNISRLEKGRSYTFPDVLIEQP
jgi:hypothetical protein